MVGSCDHGNEPLASIKGMEFLEQLSDNQLLKKLLPVVNTVTCSETSQTQTKEAIHLPDILLTACVGTCHVQTEIHSPFSNAAVMYQIYI
jgi:hypothetical protein